MKQLMRYFLLIQLPLCFLLCSFAYTAHLSYLREVLFSAAEQGDLATLTDTREGITLIDMIGDVDIKDPKTGNTALHIACGSLRSNKKLIHFLLSIDAEPLNKNNNGDTPLHLAAQVGNLWCLEAFASYLQTFDARKKHLEANSIFNAHNKEKKTLLMTALATGQFLFSEKLLKMPDIKIDVKCTDQDANHVGHFAAKFHATPELVSLIIKLAYSNNYEMLIVENNEGETCLHIAAFNGFLNVVERLLSCGDKFHPNLCYPLLETKRGTPTTNALNTLRPRITRLFLEKIQARAKKLTISSPAEAKSLEETADSIKASAIQLFKRNFQQEYLTDKDGKQVISQKGEAIKIGKKRKNVLIPEVFNAWSVPLENTSE